MTIGGSSSNHMLSPADVPPNASPIPHFTQTNPDGTEVTMHFYLHPALPLFCLAVDTVSQSKNDFAEMDDEGVAGEGDNGSRGIGNGTTTPFGAYVSAAMANCFIRHHGRTFLKSLLCGQPIKSTDLKAIKKAVLPLMKAVYRAVATDLIRSVVGGAIGDLIQTGPTAATSPIPKNRTTEEREEECYFKLTVEADGLNSLKPPGSPIGTPRKPPRPTAGDNGGVGSTLTVAVDAAPQKKKPTHCHPVALLSSSLFLVNFETPIEDVGAFRVSQQENSKKVKKTAEEKAAEKVNKNSAASAPVSEKRDLASVIGLFFHDSAPPECSFERTPQHFTGPLPIVSVGSGGGATSTPDPYHECPN